VAHRRLALDDDVLVVVIDVEGSAIRIFHLPNDDGGDFDRIPRFFIHLQTITVQVPRAKGDPLLRIEGIGPVEPVLLDRTLVGSEENQHARVVRIDDEETDARSHAPEEEENTDHDWRRIDHLHSSDEDEGGEPIKDEIQEQE